MLLWRHGLAKDPDKQCGKIWHQSVQPLRIDVDLGGYPLRNHAEYLVLKEQVLQEDLAFLLAYRRRHKPGSFGKLLRSAGASKLVQLVEPTGTIHPMLVRAQEERAGVGYGACHARVGDSEMVDHGVDNSLGTSGRDHLCEVDLLHAEHVDMRQ